MKKIEVLRTSRSRIERFAKMRSAKIEKLSDAEIDVASISIDSDMTYQTLEGFGGAFSEASAETWMKLPADKRNEVVTAIFDSEKGNGYNLCRTHMNSCDFALGNYACCDTPGDVKLKSFNINREKKAIIPLIHAAQKFTGVDNLKMMISPWSPPAWMKTNGEMNHGGKLRAEYREVWAEYYCRFIKEFEKENIPIWGLSVQNEPAATQPWDSCVYTAEEERDFVRDYLGPALWRNGMKELKLMVWDHNRYQLYERVKPIYSDPEAAKYIWGAAFHWYCDEQFDNLQRTHEAWPDKQLLFSEGCHEGGAYHGEWVVGERYAHNMINDLNRFTVGWIDWNMILDEKGGPNHVGNYCSAPVLVDTENGNYSLQSSYYYIGHFSRYIKRGAKRILSVSCRDAIECVAFLNPDGTRVAVLLNRSETEFPCYIKEGDDAIKVTLLPHSIITAIIE